MPTRPFKRTVPDSSPPNTKNFSIALIVCRSASVIASAVGGVPRVVQLARECDSSSSAACRRFTEILQMTEGRSHA